MPAGLWPSFHLSPRCADATPPNAGDCNDGGPSPWAGSVHGPARNFEEVLDSAIETLRRTVLSEHMRALAAVGSGGASQAMSVSSLATAAAQDVANASPVTEGAVHLDNLGGDEAPEFLDVVAAASGPAESDDNAGAADAASDAPPPAQADGDERLSIVSHPSESTTSHHSQSGLAGAKLKVRHDTMNLYKDVDSTRRRRVYDACVAGLIFLNVAWLRFELAGSGPIHSNKSIMLGVGTVFVVLFVIDLALRLRAERKLFFTGEAKAWNCFDTVIVTAMGLELVGRYLSDTERFPRQFSGFRVFRLVHLLRIEHLIYACAKQHDLRIMLISLVKGLYAFVCVMLVSVGFLYLFSMGITSSTLSYCEDSDQDDTLCRHFGTVTRSLLSMFLAMYDGLAWGELWMELQAVGGAAQGLFLIQIAFLKIIVLNLIISVFLGIAQRVSQSEHEARLASTIAEKEQQFAEVEQLFYDMDVNSSGAISMDEMQIAVTDPRIESVFTQLQINTADVHALFELLDEHREGAVSIEEFVAGIQWVRGGAREIDIIRVHRKCDRILRHLDELRDGHGGKKALQGSRGMHGKLVDATPREHAPRDHEGRAKPRVSMKAHRNHMQSLRKVRPHASIDKPEMRAVSLFELSYLRNVINEFCVEDAWTDRYTGEAVSPCQVDLYTLVYNFIGPRTAPEGSILQLGGDRSPMRIGALVRQFDAHNLCRAEGKVVQVTASGVTVDMRRGKFKSGKGPLRVDDVDVGLATSVDTPNSFSYKELVSSTPTRPVWFCSHWWGETVFDFINCCEEHAQLRRMDSESATYWVCGYANRQHTLCDDIGSDLEQTSFRKAMHVAQGALLHLDADATVFTRIWCDFEIYCNVSDESKELDIIMKHGGRTQLLSQRPLPGEPPRARALREENFPMSLLVKGMYTRLQDGQASVQADKDAILRYLEENGPAGEDAEANLRYANSCFHAMLATSAWRFAVKRGTVQDFDPENPGALRLPDLLRQDTQRRCLDMSLEHCGKFTDAELSRLAAALPPNLRELALSFEGCHNVSNTGLLELSRQLPPTIRKLKLDFLGCARIGDAGLQGLARQLPRQLQELDLHFDGCGEIGMEGVRELAENIPRGVKAFKATFKGTDVDRSFDAVNKLQRFVRPASDYRSHIISRAVP